VGGGVIGVATAYALCKSRPDLHILLLEAGEFGAVNGRFDLLCAVLVRSRSYDLELKAGAAAVPMGTPGCTGNCTAQSTARLCKQRR